MARGDLEHGDAPMEHPLEQWLYTFEAIILLSC